MEEKMVYDPAADKSLRPRPEKVIEMEREKRAKDAKKPKGNKKPRKERKPKAKKPKKAKKDPHIRPLILSHKTILVTIPADIRDKMHLAEAKEQNIKVKFSCDPPTRTITIKLLKEPFVSEALEALEKAGERGKAG